MVRRPTPRSFPTFFATLLLATLLLAAPLTAATDYRENYRDGIAAVEAGDYEPAIRLLRQAISGRQEARSGFRRYTPYYYLGVAQMQTGDCRAALLTWAEAENQGHIQKSREHADMVAREQRCENQLGELDQALASARAAIALAEQTVGEVKLLSSDLNLVADWSQGASSFGARQLRAESLLRDAEQKLGSGEAAVDLSQIAEGEELAVRARSALQAIDSEARQQLSAFDQAVREASGKLEDVEAGARRVLRSLGDLKPYPPQLAQRVAAMEEDLEAATDALDNADPEELVELQDRLTVSLSQLKRAAQRPPLKLVEAFQAYSVGEFEAVIEILDTGRWRPRAASHACLLKAAARHALFLLEGEQQRELLVAARSDIAQCQEGSAPLEPSADYFSPRFLSFHLRTLERLAAGKGVGDGAGEIPATAAADQAASGPADSAG